MTILLWNKMSPVGRNLRLAGLFLLLLFGVAASAGDKSAEAAKLFEANKANGLTSPPTVPYKKEASFQLPGTEFGEITGMLSEVWSSPTQWRYEIAFPGYYEIVIRDGDKSWRKRNLPYQPLPVMHLKRLLHLPSAMQMEDAKRDVFRVYDSKAGDVKLRCVAQAAGQYGETDTCFDSSTGSLVTERTHFNGGISSLMIEYGEFNTFAGKHVPFAAQYSKDKKKIATLQVKSLSELYVVNPAIFEPSDGFQERPVCAHAVYPKFITAPQPELAIGGFGAGSMVKGKFSFEGQVQTDGTIKDVYLTDRRPIGSDQIIGALGQARFKPGLCDGKPIPFEIGYEFDIP